MQINDQSIANRCVAPRAGVISMLSRCGRRAVLASLATVTLATTSGCHLVSSAKHAIPAHRLDPTLFECPRDNLAQVPHAALGQQRPNEHIIGAGDTLGIYIFGVFPPGEDETPVQVRQQAINQNYYPPNGNVGAPTLGLPVPVDANGEINLPLVDPINVSGLSLTQAVAKLQEVYRESDVIIEGRERISVGLILPRVHRVIILREDTPNPQVALVSPQAVDEIHRGSGQVIDLPVYENDVLHALASSGGLPGTDAAREVWVIRRAAGLDYRYVNEQTLLATYQAGGPDSGVVRIPLVGCADAPIPFSVNDIILNDGDVMFLPRRNEYFTAAGMLPGGRVPLPRDRDIDVIEAIAMANGSAGGPLGSPGSVLAIGGVRAQREPTRVLILRDMPGGRQITIRVDLDRAIQDHKERIRILPDDIVFLQYKPGSAILNGALDYVPGSFIPALFLD